jgi:hypothetical protein
VHPNLVAVGARARERIVAFPWLRSVLADQCRSRQRCLRTMRVPHHEYSSARKFRAHSHRYGWCRCRCALQGLARIYFLLRVRRPRGLLKNLITVAWVHGDVAVTVKNDRWDNWPSCSPALVSDPLPCRIAINAEGRSLAAPQARPECMPIAAYKSLYVAPMIAAAAAPAESPPT